MKKWQIRLLTLSMTVFCLLIPGQFAKAAPPTFSGSFQTNFNEPAIVRVNPNGTFVQEKVTSLPRATNCSLPAPNLNAPINGVTVNTLVPLFEWFKTSTDIYAIAISTVSDFSTIIFASTITFSAGYPSNPYSYGLRTNLSPNTTYYWRVASACAVGSVGAYSPTASFRTGNIAGPFISPPSMIAPADGAVVSSSPVTFSWGNVTGATGWQIRFYRTLSDAQADLYFVLVWTNTWYNSWTQYFGTTGTYYWRILAKDARAWGSLSPIRSFTVGGTASGSMTLITSPVVPTSRSLVAIARVRNTGTFSQQFDLTVRLWQSFGLLNTQTFNHTIAAGATTNQFVDFGIRSAGRYRVEATLTAGSKTLSSQNANVIVTDPNAARIILDYSKRLENAANGELNDISSITANAMAEEILSIGLDKIQELAVGKFADFAAPIQEAGGIPVSTSGNAIIEIQNNFGSLRQNRQNLSTAIRLYVRSDYGVTLSDGFDPLNPSELNTIVDPVLKDRIKDAVKTYLANWLRDNFFGLLWVNTERSKIADRHVRFTDFVLTRAVSEPSGLHRLIQDGITQILNVVEGDAIASFGPYTIGNQTLRYDLTLQEEDVKRQQIRIAKDFIDVLLVGFVISGSIIIIFLIIGAISSGGSLAVVVAPIIWKIVQLLHALGGSLKTMAIAMVFVGMMMTVRIIAPHVTQYDNDTLTAAESLISSNGTAQLSSFDTTIKSGQARIAVQVAGPQTGQSQVLVETVVYSIDGRINKILYSPLKIQAGQIASLSKDVQLAPGKYRAVTTLYTQKGLTSLRAAPIDVNGPEVQISLGLDQTVINPSQSLQAHVTLRNTSVISDTNNLTLVVESNDKTHFNAWPISLAAGAIQQIDYSFTPTVSGSYVLRASVGIGLNTLAQRDVAYVVGNGSAIALNTNVSVVYPPGLDVTLPLTLTNSGNASGTANITIQAFDRLRSNIVYTSTQSANVSAGNTVVLQATALTNAQPGLYSARLSMNGVPYDSRDFAVSATDTLFGLLDVGSQFPSVGQSVPITATVQSASSTLTDATIVVNVRSPSGTSAPIAMTWLATGTYRADFTPNAQGTYLIDLVVAQSNYRNVGDQSFIVADSPTLLVPTIEGQPKVREIRPITITVQSETGKPVLGATVVLSGTNQLLRGQSDQTGRVVFQTFPQNLVPYLLTTDLRGFAGATTQVSVDAISTYLPVITK